MSRRHDGWMPDCEQNSAAGHRAAVRSRREHSARASPRRTVVVARSGAVAFSSEPQDLGSHDAPLEDSGAIVDFLPGAVLASQRLQ